MQYDAIFFDMDGTLVPSDMEVFTKLYFKLFGEKLAPWNIPMPALQQGFWGGVKVMMQNDGSRSNEDAFWAHFAPVTGHTRDELLDTCLDFYTREFCETKAACAENPLARRAVELARAKAKVVALATNPLLPLCAQHTRMGFVGLTPADFDWVSSYETERFCKPNPAYFDDMCARFSVDPARCLMIGNDENEDMYCCTQAGLDGYLVTDGLIPCPDHPWGGPRGSFAQLVEYLEAL